MRALHTLSLQVFRRWAVFHWHCQTATTSHCANGHNVKEGGLMLNDILMLTAVMSQLGLARGICQVVAPNVPSDSQISHPCGINPASMTSS
jgi:hypothetical protein